MLTAACDGPVEPCKPSVQSCVAESSVQSCVTGVLAPVAQDVAGLATLQRTSICEMAADLC